MEATDQIDRLIERRARGREEANALAAIEKAEDARRLKARREANRAAWCEYLRRVAGSHLRAARAAWARARALEASE